MFSLLLRVSTVFAFAATMNGMIQLNEPHLRHDVILRSIMEDGGDRWQELIIYFDKYRHLKNINLNISFQQAIIEFDKRACDGEILTQGKTFVINVWKYSYKKLRFKIKPEKNYLIPNITKIYFNHQTLEMADYEFRSGVLENTDDIKANCSIIKLKKWQNDGTYWAGEYDLSNVWPPVIFPFALTFDREARISFLEHYGGAFYYDENTIYITFESYEEKRFWVDLKFKFIIRAKEGETLNIRTVLLDAEHVCTYNTLNAVNCGRRMIKHKGLLFNGYTTEEGDWPWHAAIYHLNQFSQAYKCGGTLINSNTILTAAHCVYENGLRINAERVLVKLGKYTLSVNAPDTRESKAQSINVHQNYSTMNLGHDIALIRLRNEITFNEHIQPACLWSNNIGAIQGENGTVIGWGFTENEEQSDVLSQAQMPIVSSWKCLESNREFFHVVLGEYNYCAGSRNGTSVCDGDSGGGMYVERDEVYYICGVTSVGARQKSAGVRQCDPEQYFVFTDVNHHLNWINKQLN